MVGHLQSTGWPSFNVGHNELVRRYCHLKIQDLNQTGFMIEGNEEYLKIFITLDKG